MTVGEKATVVKGKVKVRLVRSFCAKLRSEATVNVMLCVIISGHDRKTLFCVNLLRNTTDIGDNGGRAFRNKQNL